MHPLAYQIQSLIICFKKQVVFTANLSEFTKTIPNSVYLQETLSITTGQYYHNLMYLHRLYYDKQLSNIISDQLQYYHMNIQDIIERIKKEEVLDERTVKKICTKIQEILLTQANIQYLTSPINLVGDVHGQFYDVLKLLNIAGYPPTTRFIFIGDFVDRGYNSLQTILLLFCLKLLYPREVYLLRGNHESRQISCTYGFHEQIMRKYGSAHIWNVFNQTFDFLPLSAVIDNQIFCVHGGLSPEIHALDQIRELNRQQQIPTEGPMGDLMWSDPEDINGWTQNSRGVGWLFGAKVVDEFNHHNDLSLIARAHQLVQQGYEQHFKNKNIVTVWSAPNYCYRCKNLASILKIDANKSREYKIFDQDSRSMESVHYRNIIPYFL